MELLIPVSASTFSKSLLLCVFPLGVSSKDIGHWIYLSWDFGLAQVVQKDLEILDFITSAKILFPTMFTLWVLGVRIKTLFLEGPPFKPTVQAHFVTASCLGHCRSKSKGVLIGKSSLALVQIGLTFQRRLGRLRLRSQPGATEMGVGQAADRTLFYYPELLGQDSGIPTNQNMPVLLPWDKAKLRGQ